MVTVYIYIIINNQNSRVQIPTHPHAQYIFNRDRST